MMVYTVNDVTPGVLPGVSFSELKSSYLVLRGQKLSASMLCCIDFAFTIMTKGWLPIPTVSLRNQNKSCKMD